MRQQSLRILLCLMLGVVTTVGVAWGFALFIDVDWSKTTEVEWPYWQEVRDDLDTVFGPTDWSRFTLGDPVARDQRAFGLVAEIRGYYLDTGFGHDGPLLSGWITRLRTGWPVLALQDHGGCLNRDGEEVERYFSGVFLDDPQLLPGYQEPPRVLPVQPVLPGFFINTLFYAALWFALLFGLTATRRTLRRRRGCCPKCGYNLRGDFDSGCSECGWNRRTEGTAASGHRGRGTMKHRTLRTLPSPLLYERCGRNLEGVRLLPTLMYLQFDRSTSCTPSRRRSRT